MPSDIRSFFGSGPQKPAMPQKNGPDTSTPKKKRGRRVIDDSDDEEMTTTKPKKTEAQNARAQKERPQARTEETTSSEYFASTGNAKPTRSTPIRAKSQMNKNIGSAEMTPSRRKLKNGSAPSTDRKSVRNVSAAKFVDSDSDDRAHVLEEDQEGNDDIHADHFARTARNDRDDYRESEGSDDSSIRPRGRTVNGTKKLGAASEQVMTDKDAEMADATGTDRRAEANPSKAKNVAYSKAGRKRKSKSLDEEEGDFLEEDQAPKKKAKKTPPKPTAKKANKKEQKVESREMQEILDSIPTVRAPTPPVRDPNKKFQYGANQNHAPPPGAGSKEIPIGAENCLAGMTFVFTGVLDSLGREEGQSLVKKYGGKVTTGPSSKTSYVVLGNDAGPKKLETIAKLKLNTINEDGLFQLIKRLPANGGDSKAAEKYAGKKEKEAKAIRDAAAEMERAEQESAKAKAKVLNPSTQGSKRVESSASSENSGRPPVDSRLWTDKYAPTAISMVCGNKGQVERLQNWLRKWHANAKYNFKKAGPDGSGVYRAALIHGPPGIGKTTAAHLVAKLAGFDIVESNASDTRSKKLVEDGLRGVLDTTSLLGYFSGDGKKVEPSKRKLVLIMDEVDGMSAGDRGGVGALAAVAKKTSVPMILICNERRLPKMKPFDFVTWDVPFRRPTADMIRARLMTICYREGMKLPAPILDALIEGSHSDIRQIINMISTAKLNNQTMEYEEGKAMSKAWEKHVILKPWDIVGKILRPQTFAPSSTTTLNDKIELYFNDHEFSYLMLQENYLKTTPALANGYSGKERNLKLLELVDKAASSISDGDLVDSAIHGTQQQWSLMPAHAIFSFVRPASYVYGNFGDRVGFVSWLGQNSKFGKLSRYVKELQGHMRLRASGDRHEMRQQYMPLLWQKTVKKLQDEGKEKVPEVIDFMDSYFLTKDDYDAMIELGLGPMSEDHVKIDPQAKATFTRMYNAQSHPLPFMKASSVLAPKAATKAKPDLEDAIDESDVGEELVAEGEVREDEDDDVDLKKDKYIKAPKKKSAGKGAAKATGSGKRKGKKAVEDDVEMDSSESEGEVRKPKRGAAKGGRKAATVSQRPTNPINALPTSTSSSCSSSAATGGPPSAPSALPLSHSLPHLRRETRSVTGSSVRAASGQESTVEGAGVGSPSGVVTSRGVPLSPSGEGEGEGEETGSVGVTTAERSQSPPLYPQDELGIPAAAAAAEVGGEDEDLDADEPPDYFLVGADAETLFRRGVHHLHLAQGNINELDQLNGLAGGLPAAVEARRNVTVAETELRQAFTMTHREFGREDERRVELITQLTELNAQLRRDLQQALAQLDRERGRANAADQLRNGLELLLHQGRLQNQRQQVELIEAAPEIQQLIIDRDNAAADAHDLEEEARRLRLQNAQLEEEVGAIAADHADNVREAQQIHAELHRWHRRAVRLNNERAPGDRYELPQIAHRDDIDDPALHFEAGHEFEDDYDSDADTIFGHSL